MWSLSSARIVRYALAPALSLWVAGAGCMFGCQGSVADATHRTADAPQDSHQVTLVASEHSCSAGKSHGCCAKNPGGSSNKPNPAAQGSDTAGAKSTTLIKPANPSSGMKDCPLALSRAAVAKSRSIEVRSAPAIAHSIFSSGNSPELRILLASPPRLRNRGHTYLRCCVFLI